MKPDFERLLKLDFEHLIAAHGSMMRGGAQTALKVLVDRVFRHASKIRDVENR